MGEFWKNWNSSYVDFLSIFEKCRFEQWAKLPILLKNLKSSKIEFCQFLKKMLSLTVDKISNFGKSSASSLVDFLSIFEKHVKR